MVLALHIIDNYLSNVLVFKLHVYIYTYVYDASFRTKIKLHMEYQVDANTNIFMQFVYGYCNSMYDVHTMVKNPSMDRKPVNIFQSCTHVGACKELVDLRYFNKNIVH